MVDTITLTDVQQKVVNWDTGAVFVAASAGSGKTSVLVERLIKLIKDGIKPNKILAVTFTNKAANEIKERVLARLALYKISIDKKDLHIFTFHGLCNYWLRLKGSEIRLPKYEILDNDDVNKILWNIASVISYTNANTKAELKQENAKKGKQLKLSLLYKVLGMLDKDDSEIIETALPKCSITEPNKIEFVKECLKQYLMYKRENLYLDFSSLQKYGIRLFNNSNIKTHYDYIMVDESQDMNETNLSILNALCHNNNIMAVGDRLQAIFQFRGSDSACISKFIHRYNAIEIYMTNNFRSTDKIIQLANNTIISKDEKMICNKKFKGELMYLEFEDNKKEVKWLVNYLTQLIAY